MVVRYLQPLYSLAFPYTWKKDMQIMELLEQDCDVPEVMQTVSCSEDDVYQAVDRMKEFLFPGLSDEEIMEAYPPEE